MPGCSRGSWLDRIEDRACLPDLSCAPRQRADAGSRTDRSHCRQQRLRHDPRPVRLRKVRAAAHSCRARSADERPCPLDGREVEGPGADRGMVFQSCTLFPWLTVRENIAFGLRERGLSKSERGRIADGSSSASACRASRGIGRSNSPAACSNVPRSRVRLPITQRSSCSMSPSVRSTIRRAC